MAKIEWKFDGKNMIEADTATPFSFKLERYKDSSTYEESLKVYSIVNGADNGFIVTTIYNLGKDIEQSCKQKSSPKMLKFWRGEKGYNKLSLQKRNFSQTMQAVYYSVG